MALHKRKPVNTEPSAYDKLMKQLDAQDKLLKSLNERMDALIESDKAVHDAMTKKTEEVTKTEPEPEPKKEEPDVTDKAEEQAEKIENA